MTPGERDGVADHLAPLAPEMRAAIQKAAAEAYRENPIPPLTREQIKQLRALFREPSTPAPQQEAS